MRNSAALLLMWFFAGVGQATGSVIYSNFGPGMTFDTTSGHSWTINGFLGLGTGQQAIAHQFRPSGSYTFTDAQVALLLLSGPSSIAVFLQEDSGGLPGAVLEEIDVIGLTAVPTVTVANSVLRPELQDGTLYWLTVVAGAPGVRAGWSWNSIGDTSTGTNFASTQGGSPVGPWTLNAGLTRGAFQIDGTPVPDPSTWALLGTGLAGLLTMRRRYSRR